MDFETLKQEIDTLNHINPKANYTARDRYKEQYRKIYEALLEMEREGVIELEPGKKPLSYLHELLMNDGPEFCYTIVFWKKGNPSEKYHVGVCIRGLPICKPGE